MDTNLLNRILSTSPLTRKYFVGTYPSDRIPAPERFPYSMVVNLDSSVDEGSHWVAIFAPNHHEVYYFDSLGSTPPTDGGIAQCLARFKRVHRNRRLLQTPTSDFCGYYTIVFIYFCSLGESFESIMRLFARCNNRDLFTRGIVRLLSAYDDSIE